MSGHKAPGRYVLSSDVSIQDESHHTIHSMPTATDALRNLLDAGRRLSYDDIKTELDITSTRHARRLIRTLRDDGVPIQEERDGLHKRFFLPPEHQRDSVPLVELNPEEALALSVAAGAARAMLGSTPLREPLRSGFQRLVDRLSPRIHWVDLDAQDDRWYFGAIASNRIDPDVFETLVQALEWEQSLLIDYDKPTAPSTDRKIDPVCVAVLGNAIILTAYCHRRDALRDFALTRITRATLCDPKEDLSPYFDRPETFDPERYYAQDRFGALTGHEPRVYRLEIEPEVAHLFRERDYHPSQDVEHEDDEGRLVVSYEFASMQDFRSFAQGFGTRVTVLEPQELVEQMRSEAETLARRYGRMATPEQVMMVSDE